MEAISKADFCKLCEMHRESATVLEDVMRSFFRSFASCEVDCHYPRSFCKDWAGNLPARRGPKVENSQDRHIRTQISRRIK